jgi:hypothetical protein
MPADPPYVGSAGIVGLCLVDRAYLTGPAISLSDVVWLPRFAAT